jgi:hypothetical protein
MPTRRDFAKTLVAASVTLPALAQTPTPPPSPLGKALAEVTRAQYGQHLSDEELARIEKDFQDAAPFVERFRGFKLANADEPDFTFSSLVDRW